MPPRRKASVLADDDERPHKKAKNDEPELEPKAKKPRGASYSSTITLQAQADFYAYIARKVKAAPEPLVDARTAERKAYPWKLGAHVSAAGGVENSITNAVKIGCVSHISFLLPYIHFDTELLLLLYSLNPNANGSHRLSQKSL